LANALRRHCLETPPEEIYSRRKHQVQGKLALLECIASSDYRISQILVVNPERKRVILTAKKTLVESDLPVISHIDDVATGMVTHGVIVKTLEKSAVVEFCNNIRAIVPAREARYVSSPANRNYTDVLNSQRHPFYKPRGITSCWKTSQSTNTKRRSCAR
jgi:hypothetical protein